MKVAALSGTRIRRHRSEQVNDTRHGRQSCADASSDQRVIAGRHQGLVATGPAEKVKDQAGSPKPDRERDQHRVDRMRRDTRFGPHSSYSYQYGYSFEQARWPVLLQDWLLATGNWQLGIIGAP